MYKFRLKMGWDTFRGIFTQTHLVILLGTHKPQYPKSLGITYVHTYSDE
jgi:hypothetical protein